MSFWPLARIRPPASLTKSRPAAISAALLPSDIMPSKIDGCTNVIVYYGSSTYDSKQMSVLIDRIVQDCKELGIETLPPDELLRLQEEWG